MKRIITSVICIVLLLSTIAVNAEPIQYELWVRLRD